ncbi:MAG: hypothetical protein JEZ07_20120 [Phycisphaerae bacterium]|nr:hypothetical protein [Phycisphaerae bacterium]
MIKWFKQVDSILRGDATRMEAIKDGQVDIPVGGIAVVTVLLCLIYGICMGTFAASSGGDKTQLLASAVKFPLLFFLTLLITFPSLYVFNALIGSKLKMTSVLRLLVASVAVITAIAASLGTIVVFFSLSTNSYNFMVLLNVAACGIGGILGLTFLLKTLHRLVLVSDPYLLDLYTNKQKQITEPINNDTDAEIIIDENTGLAKPAASDSDEQIRSALDTYGSRTDQKAKSVFKIWVFVFSVVGAQMSWVLRPFIGNPEMDFAWFRTKESNFFQAVFSALGNLLGL